MKAAILSTGNELTRGELVDTNACWLSEQLTALGYEVTERATVSDDVHAIARTCLRLSENVDVLVCTGGLGPTTDDLTTAALALALEVPLVRDVSSLQVITGRYAARGRVLSDAHKKMADFPEGAVVLANSAGVAPGFEAALGGARCFFTPGVPREMKAIFLETIAPGIKLPNPTSHQTHLRLFGLAESEVALLLADLQPQYPELTLGFRAHAPEIEVKFNVRGESQKLARECAEKLAKIGRQRLGDVVYGTKGDSFPSVVGQTLTDANTTVALAESCTGGLAGALLTEVPGSSAYFILSAVTYANSAKHDLLSVPESVLESSGAVSAACAKAMAEGARSRAGSDLAVSITGIAGPGGGREDKPVGTVWIGFSDGLQTLATQYRFVGDRATVRRYAAFTALELLRRAAGGLKLDVLPAYRVSVS